MRTEVARDFDWQRSLIPRVKQVLASYLITEAPFEEDAHHNTDLMVLTARALRVACRLRRQDDLRYEGQFTIRSSRPSGVRTELHKVIAGWGDYIFYGFEHPDNPFDLAAWVLGDLSVYRLWLSEQALTGTKRWRVKTNADGTKFHVYNISDLPPEFVIARKAVR